MPTLESIGLRDTVYEHQSRVLCFQGTPNQKEFQASDCSLEPATLRHTARGIRWAMRQRKLLDVGTPIVLRFAFFKFHVRNVYFTWYYKRGEGRQHERHR